jgi:hypothetical protein
MLQTGRPHVRDQIRSMIFTNLPNLSVNTRPLMEDLRFSRRWLWRMVSCGTLRRVALVRTDVLEELSASFIRVTRIGELGSILAVTSNRRTLWRNTKCPNSTILVTLTKEALSSSETSVLTRATRRNIPEDTILHRPWVFSAFNGSDYQKQTNNFSVE